MTERSLDEEPPAEDAAADTADDEPSPRRRSRWVTIGIPVAGVVVAAAVVSGIVLANRGSSATTAPAASGLNYGTVARTTVAQTQSLSGTIAYSATQTITNRLTPSSSSSSSTSSASSASGSSASSGSGSGSSGSGTLTTMAAVGSTVKVGDTLYTVNEASVVAMYGTLPAYRDMQSGDTGTDVTQLQKSLADLGYNPGSTDGTFGSGTVTAVEAWQKAAGLTADGTVHLGQVVFVSGPSRVIGQLGTVGETVSSGSQIVSIGPESPIVTTSESSTQLGLLTEGQRVDVQLPNNSIVVGKVTAVGGSASSASSTGTSGSTSGSGSSSGSSSTPATVALNNPALGNSIAGSSVNVIVTTNSVHYVLAVPLGALLATSSGQFIVQVPSANGTSLSDVSVNPSIYDDTRGIVAVPGANLNPGERVVVASS
jgi:peptidoglycan hydrolase-like protein with peptidoglycan-binding domain